jgi:3-oxoacyl-[acyl-carrier protein] reductase
VRPRAGRGGIPRRHHYRASAQKAAALHEEIADSFLVQADLASLEEIDALMQTLKETAGRVDVLVNNAGLSVNADIITMKVEQFDAQRTMTRGAWYLTKRILRQFMMRAGSGRVINISSVVGHTGNPGQIAYTMEKAALDAFTRSLAQEMAGRNILVNSVAPGFIDTDMTGELPADVKERIMGNIPLGRIGRPEEIADVVAFLATRGSYITGSVVHVNGGLYGG